MKKRNYYLLVNLILGFLICSLMPLSYSYAEPDQDKTQEKFDVTDENEDSDTLATTDDNDDDDDELDETKEDSDD